MNEFDFEYLQIRQICRLMGLNQNQLGEAFFGAGLRTDHKPRQPTQFATENGYCKTVDTDNYAGLVVWHAKKTLKRLEEFGYKRPQIDSSQPPFGVLERESGSFAVGPVGDKPWCACKTRAKADQIARGIEPTRRLWRHRAFKHKKLRITKWRNTKTPQ